MRWWVSRVLAFIAAQMRAEASRVGFEEARLATTEAVAEFSAMSNLAGQIQVQRWANQGTREAQALRRPPVVPAIPFDEAIANLEQRSPRLARNAAQVAELYREGGRYFALAEAPSITVAERVQKLITDAGKTGDRVGAVAAVTELGDWSRAYSQTVVQTNMATASSAGRLAQAKRHASKFPAIEFITAGDVDVRRGRASRGEEENHAAMSGFLAAADWPGWEEWMPPLGYNCRCSIRLVSAAELRSRGLLREGVLDPRIANPPDPRSLGARKHPNF